jgi:toxin ParE1/3/4
VVSRSDGRYPQGGARGALTRSRVTVRATAKRDLSNHYRWLLGEAGVDTAERFLSAADSTFEALAKSPGIGPNVGSTNQSLIALQKWRVDGFPNLLIFYVQKPSGIAVIRVFHAAADWWSLLDVSQRPH